jgi:hypothetical protein
VDGCAWVAARAEGWWRGGRDGRDRLFDPAGELVDLAAEGVDLVQQHPRHKGVVVGELAGQGLHQRRVLDTQPTPGQLGEHLGVALTCDQRLQHGPARDPEEVGGHRPKLDQGVLQQLLQPLLVAGALGGQVRAQPGVVPQPADLGGRDERGPQHAPLVQLAQPHRIQLVGLGTARQVLDVAGVDQPYHQPPRLQQVDKRPPIVGGGLHHHPLDPLADQLVGQLQDLVGGRADLPDRGGARARLGGMRHAGAHHPRRLGDVDRGDPLHDLLMLVDLDLLACWHRPSSSPHRVADGLPGGSVGIPKR